MNYEMNREILQQSLINLSKWPKLYSNATSLLSNGRAGAPVSALGFNVQPFIYLASLNNFAAKVNLNICTNSVGASLLKPSHTTFSRYIF
jgi:hypothetical protein